MVDDPFLFGQIAAANSLSDIYAMGGKPLLALNISCFPEGLEPTILQQILLGGAAKVQEAGGLTVGGHSVCDVELKYGLAVVGMVHPEVIWSNQGAKQGENLYLTKAIGTGVLTTALQGEILAEASYQELLQSMLQLNAKAVAAAFDIGISAATDITGFGLVGHALELAQGSKQDLEIWSWEVPLLPDAMELAQMGLVPGATYRNRSYGAPHCRGLSELPLALNDLLWDPQTSGGLLLAVPEEKSAELEAAFAQQGLLCAKIGRTTGPGTGVIQLR